MEGIYLENIGRLLQALCTILFSYSPAFSSLCSTPQSIPNCRLALWCYPLMAWWQSLRGCLCLRLRHGRNKVHQMMPKQFNGTTNVIGFLRVGQICNIYIYTHDSCFSIRCLEDLNQWRFTGTNPTERLPSRSFAAYLKLCQLYFCFERYLPCWEWRLIHVDPIGQMIKGMMSCCIRATRLARQRSALVP